ncbi:MAG: tRNA 2-thiouridine(34) synthase MnmA [Patescibacteria group bacterium]
MKKTGEKKIVVAMSGGVDSSVSAALLKKEGFDVTGVFMKLNEFSSDAEKRARRIASILKIPFHVLDLRREFNQKVIRCFLDDYRQGITPNPCVVCNEQIKFGLLLEKASRLKADYIGTGHYARKQEIKNSKQGTAYKLLAGKDENKDQSYFLWKLDQERLKHVVFPVGNLKKSEVRKLAKKLKLPVYETPESQEICFIPGEIGDFLAKHLAYKKGDIVDTHGKYLGKHDGLYFYTIGQRKGIKVSNGPFYVVGKDLKKNWLIVSKNEKDLQKKDARVKDINWILDKVPELPMKVEVKIRYRSKPASAAISKNLKTAIYNLKFTRPQRAITPGQSAVFYKGDELLGGGVII